MSHKEALAAFVSNQLFKDDFLEGGQRQCFSAIQTADLFLDKRMFLPWTKVRQVGQQSIHKVWKILTMVSSPVRPTCCVWCSTELACPPSL
jgi:hypothetical protein